MLTKKVVCPQCKTVLMVQNLKDKLEAKVTCPKCQAELMVKFKPKTEPIEAHTFLGSNQPLDNSFETQLGGAKCPNITNEYETQLGNSQTSKVSNSDETLQGRDVKQQTTVTAHLTCEGIRYPLSEGRNIVGRKGKTSQATIQITTTDLYMSRQHCIIDVKLLPDGTLKAVLSNYMNKNVTYIDGIQVENGDAIRLMEGNTITMGYTTIIFSLNKKTN